MKHDKAAYSVLGLALYPLGAVAQHPVAPTSPRTEPAQAAQPPRAAQAAQAGQPAADAEAGQRETPRQKARTRPRAAPSAKADTKPQEAGARRRPRPRDATELQQLEQRVTSLEHSRSQEQRERAWLTQRVKSIEEHYPTQRVEAPPEEVEIGGALWLNYAYRRFDRGDRRTGGDFGFDLFRVSVDGSLQGILISLQYRFYAYMHAIHHGWLGYAPDDAWQVRVGVTQAPFGLLPYASHSYWFGIPYYLGMEDDYDTGVRVVYDAEPWNLQAAFFKNAEWAIPSKLDRYSFDVVAAEIDGRPIEEQNQGVARAAWQASFGKRSSLELGVSGRAGQLYGTVDDERGHHWAVAGHVNAFFGSWNLQLEGIRYEFAPAGAPGGSSRFVTLGAFAAAREVARRGTVVVANLAHTFDMNLGFLRRITCYDDYSVLLKRPASLATSWLNTSGCLVEAGPTYNYLDFIVSRNSTFMNDSVAESGLGPGAGGEIEYRGNVNVEYYF